MSYCRWSSENYRSDVYVYASGDDDSYHTCVAGNRLMWRPIPQWPSSWYPNFDIQWSKNQDKFEVIYPTRLKKIIAQTAFAFIRYYNKLHDWSFRFTPYQSIGDEFAGECFTDNSPRECADRLLMLRGRGYYVPQRAIDGLIEEDRRLTLDKVAK